MTIIKVDEPELATQVLNFIGNNFFTGERLQRFVQSHLVALSSVSQMTLNYLTGENKHIELYAWVDAKHCLVAGMTLNYYPFERLSKQLYFSAPTNLEKISVEPFSKLVSQVESIQMAVELGYSQ